MLRYRCLVLDHDDTVVRSAETVNYPQFLQLLTALRPGRRLTLEAYLTGSIDPGFHAMCRQWFGFTPEEMDWMFRAWQQYVQTHIPPAYDGIARVLRRQRALGGLLCVSSHSSPANITRDWQRHFGMTPDEIFGWELGPEKRKPSPYALQQIMSAGVARAGVGSAATMVVMMVPIIIFVAAQSNILETMASSGIKD